MTATILLVEDEPEIGEITARTIRALGYQCQGPVATGHEAIRIINIEPPSLVLMDICLNGEMDGIETAQQLGLNHSIPVVFLTAADDEETLERAKGTNPYGYIIKPFEPGNLHAAIEIALSKNEKDEGRFKDVQMRVEKRFRELAVAAIFQVGRNGENFQANDALARLLGYKSSKDLAATAKNIRQVLHWDLDGRKGSSESHQTSLPKEKFELHVYRKDGSTIWVSGNLRVIHTPSGEARLYEGKIASVAL